MKQQEGQLMLITSFVISVTMIAVISISGILTLFQIQQIENYTNSAKAIFAADTGIEWIFYNAFNPGEGPDCLAIDKCDLPKDQLPFSNGARYRIRLCSGVLHSFGWAGSESRYSSRSFEVKGFDPSIPCREE
jgi:hypothetical protein